MEAAAALREVAGRSPLLVGSDYDGVLAAIVDEPTAATPDRMALAALERLAALPGVHVAIVSGRTRADLAAVTGAPAGVALVGSHGAEGSDRFSLAPEQADALRHATDDMAEVAAALPGAHVERKPAGVALHYRRVPSERRREAAEAALEVAHRHGALRLMHGKMIVELAAAATHKGHAVERLREESGAEAVVFLGDDVTDEDAFETLRIEDVGIKVGPGPTAARYRIEDQTEVGALLDGFAAEAARRRRR